jgi:16S rRNA (uracil1498-N3)-methyltransferase
MQLYYEEHIQEGLLQLNETNTKHLIQVLRKNNGDSFYLTDGKGKKGIATIVNNSKKSCTVSIDRIEDNSSSINKVSLAIAFTKNASRMEWLLEKATEIGIAEIIPLKTARAESVFFKKERWNSILVSAMCQSQQLHLPLLHDITSLDHLLQQNKSEQKFIAHCIDSAAKEFILAKAEKNKSSLICIGPEGDFTQEEVDLCLTNQFAAVSLGSNRLRTETAGLVAITMLNAINE